MTNEQSPTGFDPYAGLGEDAFYAEVDRLVDTSVHCYADAEAAVRGIWPAPSPSQHDALAAIAASANVAPAQPEADAKSESQQPAAPRALPGMMTGHFAHASVRAALRRAALRSA